MRRDLTTSVIAIVVFSVLFGLVYPFAMTGISQVVFPGRANGSLLRAGDTVIGSRLIAQPFAKPVIGKNGKPETNSSGQPVLAPDPAYFQPRPSTATEYNAAASSFTNLGPNTAVARDTFKASLAGYLKLERPYNPGLSASQVPVDAVTSSASGVDPEISVANADIQAHRIAAIRHLPMVTVKRLISENTNSRFLGVLGEPGVDVLDLNLALNRLTGRPR
ncbi:MAG TPA: potassium-transporting ATPase subunit C [Solirubrobacteraceae bacterium]|nr:potassium-transporting ATPase subunit C [Solirubrobacteraceae bacterium]